MHAPDRLALRYAYQVLLIEEFRRGGVDVVFLNRPIGGSAEDDLLLQVQGAIAEYERARILERSRRGRRHAACSGAVSAMCGAPFGYRYVDRHVGGGAAQFEIIEDECAPFVTPPFWPRTVFARTKVRFARVASHPGSGHGSSLTVTPPNGLALSNSSSEPVHDPAHPKDPQ